MNKKAVLSSLGLLLGGRLAGNVASSAARSAKSPLRNFYTRMARKGFEEGFSGSSSELMPLWRRPLLTRLGPTTGLLDYDAARFLGKDVASKVDNFKKLINQEHVPNIDILNKLREGSLYGISKKLGLRPRQLLQQYKALPLDYQQIIKYKGKSEFSSPLFRHLSDAINIRRPTNNPTFLEKKVLPLMYGKSESTNIFGKTVGLSALNAGTQDALFQTAFSGKPVTGLVSGLVTGLAESAPEATALQLASKGRNKVLTSLKSNLVNTGYRSVQNPNLVNRAAATIIGELDSNMKEFIQMGKDLAKPFKNPSDRVIKKEVLDAVNHHGAPQNLATAAKEEILNPALNRIKTLAPNLYNQITYNYL